MILTSLSSIVQLETNYTIKTFTDPKEALEFISKNEVHIVLSDYLMPEMDGISFLAKVRAIKPDVPRVILTGYADKENAIKGINQVGLFQYIEKPWENEGILLVIRNGIEKQLLAKKLEEKMKEINKAYSEFHGLESEKEQLSKKLSEKMQEIDKAYSDLTGVQNEIIKTFI